MVLLLLKKKKKVRPTSEKILEKINFIFVENNESVDYFSTTSVCVILLWRRINTARPGNLGFGLSKKKAEPALSPSRVTDCFLLPLSL